ncbi:ABATE domain-containing protein [Lentzea sp. BCCO 10_0798]|uniref:ABATE domain-containing protein n=1 Tax=Lentzea kristufekii TaxID=3095430 RepID=A0ABU4TMU8_9PSEU|nr:ABATE domain-containing protein [Lentzea sp. BCCO 10_0798]MDX8049601.1 ABATE domain-containing protein [Lentzea sp. BCCO 10_0798]
MVATLSEFQAAGFPMGAEPLVALDLVDTHALCLDPVRDLLADEAGHAAWWALQADRLPDAAPPAMSATRRLRAVLRELFDAHLTGRTPDPALIADLNAVAAAVPTSPRLDGWGAGARAGVRWHDDYNGHPALAAIAGEAIRLLADQKRLDALRACANPACSMLFLAENKRRVWCAANVCGNRARVARHYERTRA